MSRRKVAPSSPTLAAALRLRSAASAKVSPNPVQASTRPPDEVFHLLQTLYQAFDALAKKYQVFKVETIGDSYV